MSIGNDQSQMRQCLFYLNHLPFLHLSIVFECSNFSVCETKVKRKNLLFKNSFVYFSGGPPFCLNQDMNSGACEVIENFFAYPPFQQAVDVLASSLTGFTTIIQVQEILDYVTHSFGPNPLNTTDFESMSQSFNLVIFEP